jgi:hypothetical protein
LKIQCFEEEDERNIEYPIERDHLHKKFEESLCLSCLSRVAEHGIEEAPMDRLQRTRRHSMLQVLPMTILIRLISE